MAEQTYYESKPSGKVVVTWLFTKLLVVLIMIIPFIWLGIYFYITLFLPIVLADAPIDTIRDDDLRPILSALYKMLIFLIFLSIFIIIYFMFLWKTYSYKITDKGIYFKGGIIVRKQKFVPFFKITNVETTQNIIEQIWGINKLGFQTAGTGGRPKPEIVFEGLEEVDKPKQLVYQLIEKTKKSSKSDE